MAQCLFCGRMNAMRRWGWFLVVATTSCEAPQVDVTPQDTGLDGTVDSTAALDAAADTDADADSDGLLGAYPDGRPCRGHDEDGDRYADECDDCPGLYDPDQRLSIGSVGPPC